MIFIGGLDESDTIGFINVEKLSVSLGADFKLCNPIRGEGVFSETLHGTTWRGSALSGYAVTHHICNKSHL